DQEAAQEEEDGDPELAGDQPAQPGVGEEHDTDRERPDPVERGDVEAGLRRGAAAHAGVDSTLSAGAGTRGSRHVRSGSPSSTASTDSTPCMTEWPMLLISYCQAPKRPPERMPGAIRKGWISAR